MKDRLLTLRKELGLSQSEFGERIGLQKPSISRMENGLIEPTVQTLKFICREFGVNYLWLTQGEGEMFRDDRTIIHDLIDSLMVDASEAERKVFHDMANLDKQYWVATIQYLSKIKNME